MSIKRSRSVQLDLALDTPIQVLVIDDNQTLYRELQHRFDENQFSVIGTTAPEEAVETVATVDCIVSPARINGDSSLGFCDWVEDLDYSIPYVLFSFHISEEIGAAVMNLDHTSVINRDGSSRDYERLQTRIQDQVTITRQCRLLNQLIGTLSSVQEGVAIVTSNRSYQFTNSVYARQFGYTPRELIGRHWNTVYTDETVTTLETTALPTLADDWRWCGTCSGRHNTGGQISTHTCLVSLDDSSFGIIQPGQTN